MELIKRTGKLPVNAETPFEALIEYDIIPNELHYIRNHGSVPTVESYKLEIQANEEIKKLSMLDIKSYPRVEIPVTMACDGNRRKEMNKIKRTKGFDWGPTAVSTANWHGALLREILVDLYDLEFLEQFEFVHFESMDSLVNGPYGTHIPMSMALNIYSDVLLAYGMNGEKLPPDHGYPLRTILPGCVGGRTVKWLKKISLSNERSTNWYHQHDNKVLPPSIQSEGMAKELWRDDKYVLYHMNINSVTLKPKPSERLEISDLKSDYTISGYAYDGGGRQIIRVEITIDSAKSWLECEIRYPDGYEPRHSMRYWVMCKWSISLPKWRVISCPEIIVRAWNDSMNTQPENITWNLLGMMNNCWYKVKVKRLEADFVTFLHPEEWMESEKPHETCQPPNRNYNMGEVKNHKTRDDCWVVINNIVYDLTDFLNEHPGGSASILAHSGTDVTGIFESIHSNDAHILKNSYAIGYVSDVAPTSHVSQIKRFPNITPDGYPIELNPRKWIDVSLKKKEYLTKDTRRFTFALSRPDHRMWLPWGKHLKLGIVENENMIVRPYTPVKPILKEEDNGTFELIIKIYSPTPSKPGGKMTQRLENLEIGEKVKIKGPDGLISYIGNDTFNIMGYFLHCKRVNFIAGGTGITPVLAIIRAILLAEKNRKMQLSLIFANKTLSDILCFDELEELSDRLRICHVIGNIEDMPMSDNVRYESGHVNENILRSHCFEPAPDTICLACGPPGLVNNAILPNLEKLGYDENHVYEF
jgi:nitrate reductase (NAD(P)H)